MIKHLSLDWLRYSCPGSLLMWNDLISDHFVLALVLGYILFLLIETAVRMTKNSAENSVAERRLRPIYDWLDNGNNKKALQEADKVLKKQPDFQCCRVLKCLALIRLGKEGDAESILNKVNISSELLRMVCDIDD